MKNKITNNEGVFMKRIFQFWLIFSFIVVTNCDDSPLKVPVNSNIEPTSANIFFTPDSLVLKDDTTNYLISFYGINFSQYTPDSILIDNYKFDYKINDSLIDLQVKGVTTGYHDINFYFPIGRITLDKKIKILYDENAPPTERNLYFSPDTVYAQIGIEFHTINIHGTSFYKYKIDSAYIGNEKCQIGGGNVFILPLYTTNMQTGDYPVVLYYKGNKIELPKKLTIINNIIDFDILSFNKFSYLIHKLPILYKYYIDPEYRFDFSHFIEYSDFPKGFHLNRYQIYIWSGRYQFLIKFDDKYRFIKRLSSYSFEEKMQGPPYFYKTYRLELSNIPYSVNYYEDNKIELAIELYGTKINEYYPLATYEYEWWSSQKNNDRTYGETITKTDSISGKIINYFPATDSSSIRIYLRNF